MSISSEIDALLDQFEGVATIAEYFTVRPLCVQALDSYEYGVGIDDNRANQWARFERISAVKRKMVNAQYHAIPVKSLAELCEKPVNLLDATRAAGLRPDLNTVADFLCAAVTASTSLDSVREGSEHQMGVAAE